MGRSVAEAADSSSYLDQNLTGLESAFALEQHNLHFRRNSLHVPGA